MYKLGAVVVVSPLGKDSTEFAVKRMRDSGLKADWHFHRNRIVVKVIGAEDVVEVARELWWAIVRQFKLNQQWLVLGESECKGAQTP